MKAGTTAVKMISPFGFVKPTVMPSRTIVARLRGTADLVAVARSTDSRPRSRIVRIPRNTR
jgi:hypothetical protein